MDEDHLERIAYARIVSAVPYVITSGYRCEKRNKKVRSTSRNHIEGRASDIRVPNGYARGRILKGLYAAGFVRIGAYGLWIHADTMDKPESCWL